MTPEELYRIWAPADSIWSDWVAPAFFTGLEYVDDAIEEPDALDEVIGVDRNCAVVIDMAGDRTLRIAMRLAESSGHRPVPVVNASPGPIPIPSTWANLCTVDLSGMAKALCGATPHLARMIFQPDAPPVFVLEASRIYGIAPAEGGRFDNRWMIFPEDLPSAAFLSGQGMEKVALIQESYDHLSADLSHVLLRWQEAGLTICDRLGQPLHIKKPPRFRSLWYRALAASGLRRNNAGGFGALIPESNHDHGG